MRKLKYPIVLIAGSGKSFSLPVVKDLIVSPLQPSKVYKNLINKTTHETNPKRKVS